jgi:hypothetical protein
VLPIVLAAAFPPLPPVWVALVGAATLAVAETVTFPLNPLTVRFDEPAMLGLQPPAASTIGGVATPATHIAIVNSAIHLFIRFVLYRFGRLRVSLCRRAHTGTAGAVGEPERRTSFPFTRRHSTAARVHARLADQPSRPALCNESR